MINLATAALLLLSVGQAPTPTTSTVDSAAVIQQSVRNDAQAAQRVCVRGQDGTGTILTRTICRTRAEWDRAGGVPGESNR